MPRVSVANLLCVTGLILWGAPLDNALAKNTLAAATTPLAATPPLPTERLALGADIQPPAPLLKAYRATYASNWSIGIPVSGEAFRELRPTRDGQWLLIQDAKALGVARQREETRFALQADQVVPQHYHYERKVFGRKRKASLDFDWTEQQVTNHVQDDIWRMQLPVGAQDHLSYQLQLRLDLLREKQELVYQVADGGKLKEYRFERDGEETLDTPIGPLKTLRVRRVREAESPRDTLIWFATELEHLIVKISQLESDGKRYELLIQQVENLRSPTSGD